MNFGAALLVGRSIANDRPACDERGPGVGHRFAQRATDIVKIMTITADHMPTGGTVARSDVFAGRQVDRTIDGDPVVIPQNI